MLSSRRTCSPQIMSDCFTKHSGASNFQYSNGFCGKITLDRSGSRFQTVLFVLKRKKAWTTSSPQMENRGNKFDAKGGNKKAAEIYKYGKKGKSVR